MRTIICGFVAMTMAVNAQSLLDSAGIVFMVSPAVVVIQGQSSRGTVVGTGVIVSRDGKMATNLHVIRDLTAAGVQLANGDVFDSFSVLAFDERETMPSSR